MKNLKLIKTGLTGGICLGIGTVIFIIGFAASGFNFDKVSFTDPYDKKTMTVSGSTKIIEISEDDSNINISQSEDNDIHITYFENKYKKYTVTEGDTLKIQKHSSKKIEFGVYTQDSSLYIQIPEKCKAALKINSDNSNIKTENISAKSFEISVDDGNISIENVVVDGDSDISTKSGNFLLSDCKFNGKFMINTNDGNVKSDNCEYKENAGITTDCGSININSNKYSADLSLKTSDGNVKSENCEYTGKTEINTVCGNVTLDNITCNSDLSVTTDDGNVKGTVNGSRDDFNIESNTKDGNNNLEDKTLSVKTDCGNIKFDFR